MDNIYCVLSGISIVTQSSGHSLFGMGPRTNNSDREKDFLNSAVGGIISIILNYFGLLSCMTSLHVKKVYTSN